MKPIEEDVTEEVDVPAQVNESISESERNSVDLQIPISDESDSLCSDEDEPLFSNFKTCQLNHLTILEQEKAWLDLLLVMLWLVSRMLFIKEKNM